MADDLTTRSSITEVTLLKLAREIAMDIQSVETILKTHLITPQQWEMIQTNSRFQALLMQAVETWNTALNAPERVKIKAAAMIEEWLPELNNRIHDRNEGLPAKIEGGKLLTKLAGLEARPAAVGDGGGERFTVTINLGTDQAITIEKDLPPKVIDHEPLNSDQ